MATKKSAPTKAASKKAPAARSSVTKASARKAPAKSAAKQAPAKSTKGTVTAQNKKAPAKKAPAANGKKAPATSTAKAPATKAPAAKAKAPAAKSATPAKAGAPAKAAAPKPVKSPFDAKFIESQRELLLAERANYTKQAEAMMAEAISLTENREPGDVQFDEESGEGDTLAVERERDLALSAQARAAIEEIDAALGRIKAGTYGICRVSGTPIPKERLKAIPWATERVEYKVGGFGRL